MNVWQKIRSMIKMAKVTKVVDSENYPTMQVSYNEVAKDVAILTPYGLSMNPPVSSLSLCFSVLGQESTVFSMPNDYPNRFKDLKTGEVATGNYITGSRTFYDTDGNAIVFGSATSSLAGSKVYIGDNDGSTDVLSEVSDALQAVSDALAALLTATYPSAVGPAGPMAAPASTDVSTAKSAIDAVKTKIDGIKGDAPNVN